MTKGFLFCLFMFFTTNSFANSHITLTYEGKEYTLTNVDKPQDFFALDKTNNILVEDANLATELYVGLQSYKKIMSSNLALESPDELEVLKTDAQGAIATYTEASSIIQTIDLMASISLDISSTLINGIKSGGLAKGVKDSLGSYSDTLASTIISSNFSTAREAQVATAYGSAISESVIYTQLYNEYQDIINENSNSIEGALIIEEFIQDAKDRFTAAETSLNILKKTTNLAEPELLVMLGNTVASAFNQSTLYTVVAQTALTLNQAKLFYTLPALDVAPILELPYQIAQELERLVATATFVNRGYEYSESINVGDGLISGSTPDGATKNIEINTVYNFGTGEFTVALSKAAKEILEAEGYVIGNGLTLSELLKSVQILMDNGMTMNPFSQFEQTFDTNQIFDDVNFSLSGLAGSSFDNSFITQDWLGASHSGSITFSLNNDSTYIQGSSDFENETLNLITGSPVSIDQYLTWEDSGFLSFDYLFEDGQGILDVLANGQNIFSINGETAGDDWTHEEIWLDVGLESGSTFNLEFRFDDIVSGTNLLLDNIDFTNIENGDFSQNLYIWNTKGEGKAKIVDEVVSITVPEPSTYLIFIIGVLFVLCRNMNIINANKLI